MGCLKCFICHDFSDSENIHEKIWNVLLGNLAEIINQKTSQF